MTEPKRRDLRILDWKEKFVENHAKSIKDEKIQYNFVLDLLPWKTGGTTRILTEWRSRKKEQQKMNEIHPTISRWNDFIK